MWKIKRFDPSKLTLKYCKQGTNTQSAGRYFSFPKTGGTLVPVGDTETAPCI